MVSGDKSSAGGEESGEARAGDQYTVFVKKSTAERRQLQKHTKNHCKTLICHPLDKTEKYLMKTKSWSDEVPSSQPKPNVIRAEDLFWSEKAKLFSDIKQLEKIDRQALKASLHLRNNPESLVTYLTQGFSKDFERFRSIFRWVAENVAYDVDSFISGEESPSEPLDVLRTGRAVCAGYANVLRYLCEFVQIECKMITGISKGTNYYPGKPFEIDSKGHPVLNYQKKEYGHAWNIVTLAEKRYLCDVTWAAGTAEEKQGRIPFNKRWNESWFICEPQAFLETHWPMSDKKSAPEMQLMKTPIKSFMDWNQRAHRGIGSYELQTCLFSHKHGVIKTNDNELTIKIKYKFPVQIWATLESVDTGSEFPSYVIPSMQKGIYLIYIRLPEMKKRFKVKINGKPMFYDGEAPSYKIVQYTVESTGILRAQPFPDKLHYLGFTRDEFMRGYCLKKRSTPIITSQSGKAKIKITIPPEDGSKQFHATCMLLSCEKELCSWHYVDKTLNQVIIGLNLPHQGQYLITLYVEKDAPRTVGGSLEAIGYFIVVCSRGGIDKRVLPIKNTAYGASRELYRLNCEIYNQLNGVIKTRNGECVLVMKMPEYGIDVAWGLYIGEQQVNKKECICAETYGRYIRFRFRLPEAGFYHFTMNRTCKSGEHLCAYLIDCKQPYQGELFLSWPREWGTQKLFKQRGFQCINQSCSSVVTTNGKCEFKLKNPRNERTMCSLLNASGDSIPTERLVNKTTTDDVVSFELTLTERGQYAFRISKVKRDDSWDDWLVVYHITCLKPAKLH
ncbi:kyphoscoliosis peptidase-like [Tubulanus polymorphus]|uniref:kyphoscoliosis peptidase-like n=1 Tax=Tubulanus polymorphus TaxID=672921 RepID=UPI003DA49338